MIGIVHTGCQTVIDKGAFFRLAHNNAITLHSIARHPPAAVRVPAQDHCLTVKPVYGQIGNLGAEQVRGEFHLFRQPGGKSGPIRIERFRRDIDRLQRGKLRQRVCIAAIRNGCPHEGHLGHAGHPVQRPTGFSAGTYYFFQARAEYNRCHPRHSGKGASCQGVNAIRQRQFTGNTAATGESVAAKTGKSFRQLQCSRKVVTSTECIRSDSGQRTGQNKCSSESPAPPEGRIIQCLQPFAQLQTS